MIPAPFPLLARAAPDAPIAWWRGQPISQATFLRHVAGVARRLPPARFILNLCEDRYRFLVAFAAVGANGQTSLLPSSRASLHLRQLAEDYPASRPLADSDVDAALALAAPDHAEFAIPELSGEHLMAIAFTSGSTGHSKPNPKTWNELVCGAEQARRRFGFAPGMTIVATVPPQHMYGLETSIMAPLVSGARVHGGRPFFPDDVRAALDAVPPPRVLVTTPIHLQACVQAGLHWPRPVFLISATAPLPSTLAAQAEAMFAAPVLEIYGCTEAGSIASRRTLDGDRWRLYDGFQLRDGSLAGAHLPEPVTLNDVIEECGADEFRLLGRREDLVNIAGKRTSLSYLNHQLQGIEGVAEGVFVMPAEAGTEVRRLLAVVVAPGLSERQLLAALAERLDPVFLPRPLIKVSALPRSDTGKVTRAALLALITAVRPSALSVHEA
ncbi:MAG: AMP-binding protein [Candidatus Contendobacter sp.]|nr:AMP-binding protein [Candidatus Contendobacter sp.]